MTSIPDGNNQKININLNIMGDFQSDTFVTRTSNLYTPFIYDSFVSTKNTEHCSIHCFFDGNDNCDFHFLYNGYCYLGNFNTETAIGSTSSSHTMYIFKGIVYNLLVLPPNLGLALIKKLSSARAIFSKTFC